jgi:hypothetical protein
MSIDSKLYKICDHKIYEEDVQIDDDLKTIRLPRTLTSKKILLYINGFLIDQNNPQNGWFVENDERTSLTYKQKIVFHKKRKSSSDFFHVTYSVEPDFCPKCFGAKVHDDISFSSLGKTNMVENEEKLLQEVRKGVTTHLGSNPFHTWIGTQLYKLIGSKVADANFVRATMIQEVNDYLEKYLEIQTQQAKYQDITDRESFLQSLLIDAQQDDFDPTVWILSIIFQNRTGNEMIYERKIEIPGSYVNNLLNSNNKKI